MENMKQVEIPNDYFYTMSRKDYSHLEVALIREFFQNSVDASAKQFVFDYDQNNGTLTIFDDGAGMDYDTLVNKLLVMGKSFKTSEDAVGAFGHAKILLYFSWESWEIRTRNFIVTGSSHYYTITETDDFIDGTISTIKVDDKLNSFMSNAVNFFSFCDTQCKVYKYSRNEENVLSFVNQGFKIGDSIYSDDSFNIYKTDKIGWYISIRQGGILMFNYWLSNEKKNQVIVELKKRPELLLLQNRDYFNSKVSDTFSSLKNQLAIDSIDTFTLKHDKVATFNVFDAPTIDKLDDKISILPAERVITHGMDDDESIKEINRLRSQRILNIAYAFADKIAKKYDIGRVIFGFTQKNEQNAFWRWNHELQENEIYLNLDYITNYSPNYRRMAILLWNVIKHEMSHGYTNRRYNSSSHNENFVKVLEGMNDAFWDTTPIVNIFKKVWKETAKENKEDV